MLNLTFIEPIGRSSLARRKKLSWKKLSCKKLSSYLSALCCIKVAASFGFFDDSCTALLVSSISSPNPQQRFQGRAKIWSRPSRWMCCECNVSGWSSLAINGAVMQSLLLRVCKIQGKKIDLLHWKLCCLQLWSILPSIPTVSPWPSLPTLPPLTLASRRLTTVWLLYQTIYCTRQQAFQKPTGPHWRSSILWSPLQEQETRPAWPSAAWIFCK